MTGKVKYSFNYSNLLLPSGIFFLVVSDISLLAEFQTFLLHTFLDFLGILDTNALVSLEFPGRQFLRKHFVHCILVSLFGIEESTFFECAVFGFWKEEDEPDEHDEIDWTPDPSDFGSPPEMLRVEEVGESKSGQPGEKEGD